MLLAQLLFRSYIEDGEKIYFVAHRHVFTLYKPVVKLSFFGFLIPGALIFLFPQVTLLLMISIAWISIALIRFLYILMKWYFDAWLVTNTSVIDIQWNGFFDRAATRIEYHTIEGVSNTIKGFWGTVLNFGNIALSLVASGTQVSLENAKSPRYVEQVVLKAQEEFLVHKASKDQEALKALLAGMIQQQRVHGK